jgi:GT2 family glycosyltransferase
MNRLRAGAVEQPYAYRMWIDTIEKGRGSRTLSAGAAVSFGQRPSFSILLHAGPQDGDEAVQKTLRSVEEQRYDRWNLVIVMGENRPETPELAQGPNRSVPHERSDCPARALQIAIGAASGDYLVPLQAGVQMASGALLEIAGALGCPQPPHVIFGDEDEIDDRGKRKRPWFKPDWNQEMFFAIDYLSAAVAIESTVAKGEVERIAPGNEPVFELLLAVTARADVCVGHVPSIFCHVNARAQRSHQTSRVSAVSRHLKPLGATASPGPFGTVKVTWPLPSNLQLISIIIPTRDKVDLLRACVDSILGLTTYERFEIIIVDNGSAEQSTLDYFAATSRHSNVRVLNYERDYNYSAINNFAVSESQGEYVCLLNNDTEVISGDWLTEMMRYAVQPKIGAVGAKLLYEDRTIQHAGVVIGLGDAAGHPHRYTPADEPGYFCQTHVAHFASAVTAACLVVNKAKYESVGGLDEQQLAIAYNDVDLCLKLERAGWRNVYVPSAVLFHYESKSRGSDVAPENVDRYMRELRVLQERWGTKTYQDPLHNPNLDRYSEMVRIRL